MEGGTNMKLEDSKEQKNVPEPFGLTEMSLTDDFFENQYTPQDLVDKLKDHKDVEFRVNADGKIVIRCNYRDVKWVVEQLSELKEKSDGEAKQKATESVHSVNEKPLDATETNVNEPVRPGRKPRQLVKDRTPDCVSDIPIDEHIWCYLNEVNADKIKDIERKYSCELIFFCNGKAASCVKVCTSSIASENFDKEKAKKRLDDATEAFAEIYQRISGKDIKEEMWKISRGLSKQRAEELENICRAMNFVLAPIPVYRFIGPESEYQEATKKLQELLKEDEINWIQLQPKDEPVANGHNSQVQPEQMEWESSVSPSQSVEKTGGHVTEEKGKSSASLQFTTPGGIRVRVAQGNLVHQSVDAIVNPANSNLNHGSGAAEAISKAAGEELNRECRDFIRKNYQLDLTYVTHTTAGRLKPKIKYVIHAVGPRKTHQTSNDQLYNNVKHTIYNCLQYANTHVKIKSIAIPAISSGIFGVPLEIVAKSSFDALMKFDKEFKGKNKDRTLQEVNFVNIDERTFTFMKNAFAEFHAKNIGSSVDPPKNHVSQRELLDNYASAWRRRRVEMEPDEKCFAQAIAAALRNDFEKESCSCEEVEGRIEYEINTNHKYYKKFQMDKYGDDDNAVVKWFKNLFNRFIDNSDCEWDMILSAAANVFKVEIFLIQLAENNATIERSFSPRSGLTHGRSIYLAYYYDGHSHFDPLVLNSDSANVKSDHFPAHNSYGSRVNTEDGLSSAGSSSSDRQKPSSSSGMSKDHGRERFENISAAEAADMPRVDLPQTHKPNETKTEKPSGDEEDKLCIICMDEFTDPVTLDCKHKFCRQCIDDCFSKHQPKCPSCGRVFGAMRGTQPKGTMSVSENSFTRLPGFSDCGAIEITYHFPNGVQGEEHPNPGQRYKGTSRTAYLPANQEGREILQLLRKAFDAQLVFTIGRSNTTGQENVVIWNDVHHKTSIHGQYGYPDPTYLKRVREELAAKGIQ